MLFNSFEFLIFFPLVAGLYFLFPHRLRYVLLLLASAVFYMAFVPRYIIILVFTIIVNYAAALVIDRATGRTRRVILVAALVTNVSVLVFFKYYAFLTESLAAFLGAIRVGVSFPALQLILPIGISFFTFQAMSYTIEVYWGRVRPERHLGIFALFIAFWPQLVAGPIERPQNLLSQFRERHHFDAGRVADGLKLVALGMFKKVVIADSLAVWVDRVYAEPTIQSGTGLLLGTLFFAFQIYYDFSGYSDIAIGCARVMGFRLMKNFDAPYLAPSIAAFWRRWHISLSTWFRDYLYIPLGGNRGPAGRVYFNVLVVFVVSGLWHGAAWTFAVWGALHGLLLVAECEIRRLVRIIRPSWDTERGRRRLQPLSTLATFSLVVLAWVFFRAETVGDALHVLSAIFLQVPEELYGMLIGQSPASIVLGVSAYSVVAACVLIAVMLLVDVLDHRGGVFETISRLPVLARYGVYFVLLYAPLLTGNLGGRQQFIYFQF